ncbi:cupin domain-containing protein [Propionibacteriaceae bacterium Y2011]
MISIDSLGTELEVDTRNRGSISGDVVRSAHSAGEIGTVRTGMWEVTPGTFEGHWTSEDWEIFTVIAGRGTFTTDDGEVHQLVPGALFVMPPDTHGVWDVQETLRKTFVFPIESADRR